MSDPLVRVYVSLGSNLSGPMEQVLTALDELAALPQSRLLDVSPLYLSAPLGPPGQPDYVNAVACLETRLEAHALLDELQAIERDHQRVRNERWGPRTLDLDLLVYGDRRIQTERLTVPHPEMTSREFVLVPLQDLAPALSVPGIGVVSDLVKPFLDHSMQRLDPDQAV